MPHLDDSPHATQGWIGWTRRLAPALLLAAAAAVLYASGIGDDLTLHELTSEQAGLRGWIAAAPLVSLIVFTLVYAVAVAAFVPVGLVLMVAGGFLFGPIEGTAATIAGGTLGALMTYVAARLAAGESLRRRLRDGRLGRLMRGFEASPFVYLLSLRLLPFSPFGLVNVAAGVARAPVRKYLAATAVGAAPYSLVYSFLGAGLGKSLAAVRGFEVSILTRPEVFGPLTALAALSLAAGRVAARLRTRRQPAR